MINKESNFISAVVYLHKGDTNVYHFVKKINNVLCEKFKKYEIICINDDAGDAVVSQVKRFHAENDEVVISIVNMGMEHGLEAAMNAGIDLSIGDFVYEFDSCYDDFSSNLIFDVYSKALEGYDIVSAVPPKIKTTSKIFYALYNMNAETGKKLETERFRIISRRAINRVFSYSKTMPYRKAIYASSGLNMTSIHYNDVVHAESGQKSYDVEKNNTAIDSLVIFTNLAYKISLIISILMAIFMIGCGGYTFIVYLGENRPVEGWTTLMGLLSSGFCAMFVILTIIIKYLDVILKLVFKKQKYMISSIEKM